VNWTDRPEIINAFDAFARFYARYRFNTEISEEVISSLESMLQIVAKIAVQEEREKLADKETNEKPDPILIDSMCMRFDHAFFVDSTEGDAGLGYTEQSRNALRSSMRQVWEEVVGRGFYPNNRNLIKSTLTEEVEDEWPTCRNDLTLKKRRSDAVTRTWHR